MIICPACKEEIEDDSHYCDQCGQQLLFCKQCGHVGIGRRCTRCGGVMALRQGGVFEQQPAPSVNVAPAAHAPRPNVPPVSPISIISSQARTSGQPGQFGQASQPISPSQAIQPGQPSQPSQVGAAASISVGPAISIAQAAATRSSIPSMTLVNESLGLRIVAMNGAIIGRRKGPYVQFFEQHSYVSGIHAQLKFKSGTGWCVIDKNSSNGTRVNQNPIQPEVETLLKNGDMLTIANIDLQVIIR